MPHMNGIEATRRLKEALPESRVIGLSMHEESDMAQAILDAGAVEYLRKDIAADALLTSILRLGSLAPAK
jgi:DNA-binding NarL/FixJ family response regulator